MSRLKRETRETTIELEARRGGGAAEISTGDAFLDHMLNTLGRYAGIQLTVRAHVSGTSSLSASPSVIATSSIR